MGTAWRQVLPSTSFRATPGARQQRQAVQAAWAVREAANRTLSFWQPNHWS